MIEVVVLYLLLLNNQGLLLPGFPASLLRRTWLELPIDDHYVLHHHAPPGQRKRATLGPERRWNPRFLAKPVYQGSGMLTYSSKSELAKHHVTSRAPQPHRRERWWGHWLRWKMLSLAKLWLTNFNMTLFFPITIENHPESRFADIMIRRWLAAL